MPSDPLALSTVSPAPPADAAEYDAICAAMTATARGRWFLEEFSRRNRNCDTTQVLDAIARMEATVLDNRAKQASQEVRLELLEMARTIAQARADVAGGGREPPRAATETAVTPASPEIAAVAERLRQIAWTVRACGIDLPASDQIGEIAEMLLSARALRNLGNQQTQKLAEVLHYLEHRIDQMLDGQLAAGLGGSEPTALRPRPTQARDTADDGFPLTLTDMTAANTNEAEAAAVRAPVVITVDDTGDSDEFAAPIPPSDAPELTARDDRTLAADIVEPPRPPMVEITGSTTTSVNAPAPQEAVRALEMMPPTMSAASAVAVPVVEPARPAASTDPIAAQVEHDLDDLTDFAAPNAQDGTASPQVSSAQAIHPPPAEMPQAGNVVIAVDDDPADFLFEAPSRNTTTPVAAAGPRSTHATAANAQPANPQMSTVLAAIATELLAENKPETRAKLVIPGGALALLMAMSEEERIALFS